MANPKDIEKALTPAGAKPVTLYSQIDSCVPQVSDAMGLTQAEQVKAIQFLRQVKNLITTDKTGKLARCTIESFRGAILKAAALNLGLNPSLRTAYLVPYEKRYQDSRGQWQSVMEVEFQIGVGGLVELFYRHEKSVAMDVYTVHENDVFDFEYGTNPRIVHRPALSSSGDAIAYYAVAHLAGGQVKFLVLSKENAVAHAKQYSPHSWDAVKGMFKPQSAWGSAFDAMAQKTVAKALCKYLPLSVDVRMSLAQDGSILRLTDAEMREVASDREALLSKPNEIEAEPTAVVDVPAPSAPKETIEREVVVDYDDTLPCAPPAAFHKKPEPEPQPAAEMPAESAVDKLTQEWAAITDAVGKDDDSKIERDPSFARFPELIDSGQYDEAAALVAKLRSTYMISPAQQKAVHAILRKIGKKSISEVFPDISSTAALTKKRASDIIENLGGPNPGKKSQAAPTPSDSDVSFGDGDY